MEKSKVLCIDEIDGPVVNLEQFLWKDDGEEEEITFLDPFGFSLDINGQEKLFTKFAFLEVEETYYLVHKDRLSKKSSFFKSLFQQDFREKNLKVIPLTLPFPRHFLPILYFLHIGHSKPGSFTTTNIAEIMRNCDFLGAQEMLRFCSVVIARNWKSLVKEKSFNVQNICSENMKIVLNELPVYTSSPQKCMILLYWLKDLSNVGVVGKTEGTKLLLELLGGGIPWMSHEQLVEAVQASPEIAVECGMYQSLLDSSIGKAEAAACIKNSLKLSCDQCKQDFRLNLNEKYLLSLFYGGEVRQRVECNGYNCCVYHTNFFLPALSKNLLFTKATEK